jgi:hypothetical protein
MRSAVLNQVPRLHPRLGSACPSVTPEHNLYCPRPPHEHGRQARLTDPTDGVRIVHRLPQSPRFDLLAPPPFGISDPLLPFGSNDARGASLRQPISTHSHFAGYETPNAKNAPRLILNPANTCATRFRQRDIQFSLSFVDLVKYVQQSEMYIS